MTKEGLAKWKKEQKGRKGAAKELASIATKSMKKMTTVTKRTHTYIHAHIHAHTHTHSKNCVNCVRKRLRMQEQ